MDAYSKTMATYSIDFILAIVVGINVVLGSAWLQIATAQNTDLIAKLGTVEKFARSSQLLLSGNLD